MSATTAGFEFEDFFSGLVEDLQTKYASDSAPKDILDFLENHIDKEAWGIELNRRQKLILKCFYGLELDEIDIQIIDAWRHDDRTSYDFDIGSVFRQYLVVEAGRRGSKCKCINSTHIDSVYGLSYGYEFLQKVMPISTNSFVNTEQGIEKLITANLKSETYYSINIEVAQEGIEKRAKADSLYYLGYSKTLKIETSCGYNLEATGEHRIKVMTEDGNIEWRHFNELRKGDYACIHRRTNLFPSESKNLSIYHPETSEFGKTTNISRLITHLDDDWAYLLGLLVSNGSWTKDTSVECTFHTQDEENYINAYYKTIGALNNDILIKSESRKSCNNGSRICVNSIYIRKFLHNLGWRIDVKSDTKATPHIIRSATRSQVIAYLSGLFDGDGTVSKCGRDISLSTASKKLAHETQLLLLNLGIVSRIGIKKVNGKEYYNLYLRGKRSIEMFAREIKFKLARKQKIVEDYLVTSSRDGGDTERIPYQYEWLRRLIFCLPTTIGKQPGSSGKSGDKIKNLRSDLRKLVGNAVKGGGEGELLSSYRLNKILEFADEYCLHRDREAVEHFRYIKDCDYFYDKIESIEESNSLCYDLSVPKNNMYVANGFTNHNTSLAAVIIGYEWYKLCIMDSPQKHYGIAGNTLISIYCLATGAEQSKKTIYGQAKAFLYFIPFIKKLILQGKIVVGEEQVKYQDKLLYIYSGNSKSSSQVGGAIILLVMDEIARFINQENKSNAMELWVNLGNSGVTFGKDFKALAISSAWEENDAIQKLYGISKEPAMLASWIGFRLRSWDLNPVHGARDNPVIQSAYAVDPVMAALDYEGIRRTGQNTFFNPNEVKRCFRGKSVITAARLAVGEDSLIKIHITNIVKSTVQTVMHLDPAIKRDAYGLAFGHVENNETGEKIVIIDGILAWEPDPETQVSITNVQSCVYQIHNARPIFKLSADHAQSDETIQRLKAAGISAEAIFFSNRRQVEMYDATRKLMHEDRLILPKNSPWTGLLTDELLYVQHDKETKIDHMPGRTKDVADAVCAVVWRLLSMHSLLTANEFGKVEIRANKNHTDFQKLEEDFQSSRNELRRELKANKSHWRKDSAFELLNQPDF